MENEQPEDLDEDEYDPLAETDEYEVYACDVCGKIRPIVYHGFVCGTETAACAECVGRDQ